ncbi:MAG TPA: ATP-binding protein [Chloroflexota bacterium]|nr:ATP-binding protein [Chloroflexota bacterium]
MSASRPDARSAAATSRVRTLSVRAQLVLFAVLLVLVAAGGSALAGWRIVDGLIRRATTDRLNVASSTFGSLYQQRVADAEIVTRQLSEKQALAQRINQRNSDLILQLIEPIQTLRPNYSVVVADRQLVVLAKVIPPGRVDPGNSLADVPGAPQALEIVDTVVALIQRADCQMVITANVPVRAGNGTVVGLMHVRLPLDEEFVRQVKSDTGLELSLYCGDTLVASTLAGQQLGTKAEPEAIRRVLGDTLEWEQNVVAGGQTYRTRYVPLLDINGAPAGMYGVSTPVQTLSDARNAILRYFLPTMLLIAALAMAIGYLGANVLTRPLRRLAAAAAQIGSGDLDTPIAIAGDDEVGQLAQRMEEMRRSLSETYSQLRQLNQLKDEYLFTVAHEVRTPLASLVASVEILAADFDEMTPDERRSTVRRIERSAVRLHTLVENVLDAGSIRAGRFSIAPTAVHLADTIDGAVGTVQPLLDEKAQRIVVDVPSGLPAVFADERRLLQVFANLLSNASKYGPAEDTIRVDATVADGTVTMRVTDHGPGIPLPEQGELFERYFRSSSSARTSPGTGLGLAITKAIVEAHGGAIGLESDPDRGTTVWFTLPVAAHGERAAPREPAAAGAA